MPDEPRPDAPRREGLTDLGQSARNLPLRQSVLSIELGYTILDV
jgi:hypothetical protein